MLNIVFFGKLGSNGRRIKRQPFAVNHAEAVYHKFRRLFDKQEQDILHRYVSGEGEVLDGMSIYSSVHDALRDAFYESAKYALNQSLMRDVIKDDTRSNFSPAATPLMLERVHHYSLQYAKKNSGDLITGVTERTQERVNDLVTSALKEGWGVEKLQQELQRRGHFSEQRAETIARTEISAAQNAGMVRAGKEYAKHTGDTVMKVWVVTGSNPCIICEEHDGQIVDVGEKFEDGLTVPAHPRCMCEIQLVVGLHDIGYEDD